MFLPVHRIEEAPGAFPDRTAFVLHGILGSLRNWRTIARRIVRKWPEWRIVLVDIRNHGDSRDAPAPHTLAACAEDLANLAERLGEYPELVMGHSFGGKVALTYARDYPDDVASVWVLDSSPAAMDTRPDVLARNDVVRVIQALSELPMPLAQRSDVVRLLSERGFGMALAQWMTTNLRREDDGYHWRFDLPAVREMLADYADLDLVNFVNDTHVDVHFVWGGRSGRFTPQLAERLSAATDVSHHTLPEAGHWLHAEDPDGLMRVLAQGFGGYQTRS